MDLLVFDFDGTLVDSDKYFLGCMEKALKPYGIRPDEALIEQIRARHPEKLFDELLGHEEGQKAINRLREASTSIIDSIEPFTGIKELLAELDGQGQPISIWTGRDRYSTEKILHSTGLDVFFKDFISGSCVNQNKPAHDGILQISENHSTDIDRILVVGDHSHDIQPANELGCTSVHARWKAQPHQLEEHLRPDQVFTSVGHFHDWLIKTLG